MSACYRLVRSIYTSIILLGLISLSAQAEVITYQYDEADRLITTSYENDGSVNHVYDPLGNRQVKTVVVGALTNQPPLLPASPIPADGATNISPDILLQWQSIDPDVGDFTLSSLFFDDTTPPLKIKGGLNQGQYLPATLKSNTTYYWSITSTDNYNAKTSGPIWSFTTGNTPPLLPENLLPINGSELLAPLTHLSWTSNGDPNPNDTETFDVYYGTSVTPPLVSVNQSSQSYSLNDTLPKGTYYWKIVAKDNNGATTSSPLMSFSYPDIDQDYLPDYIENSGCTDTNNYDSDGDSIPDGDEDTNHNGSVDTGETNPCKVDSDNDGMSDGWELVYGLDPLTNDADLDNDGDGLTNYQEFIAGNNPTQPETGSDNRTLEGFESGNFQTIYWQISNDNPWTVVTNQPFNGDFSVQSPTLKNGETASLETWMQCDAGEIYFYHTQRTVLNGGWLRFYIDGTLVDEWSGPLPYQLSTYTVTEGTHHFAWKYVREHEDDTFLEQVHIDDISFPGIPDADNDGVLDGWEIQHFSNLSQNLCTDSDGDGLSDLEEAIWYSSPHALDTDGDGIPDFEEVQIGSHPARIDALTDSDGDGETNISEYLSGTNPNSTDDFSYGATETFETGDLKRFSWTLSGDGLWSATTTNSHEGHFSAQPGQLSSGKSASMETIINSNDGVIAFHYALINEGGGNSLTFYIDDVQQKTWTKENGYTQVIFPVQAGIHTFKWRYTAGNGDSSTTESAWVDTIIFPGTEDSDNDGLPDAWEIQYTGSMQSDLCQDSDGDGLSDLAEAAYLSDPQNADTDQDGLSDGWEIENGFDPTVADALGDADGDGATTIGEFLAGTDPHSIESFPEDELEDFETGDFSKFNWQISGDGNWQLTEDKTADGKYAAQSANVIDGGSVTMETTLNSLQNSSISFHYAVSSQESNDFLEFYIDDTLMGSWSGEIAFSPAVFPVSAGRHQYRWVYRKNSSGSAGADKVWVDRIIFPGLADSDNDGVNDSWEYLHFNSLTVPLCSDSDGDGLKDIEEALAGTDPTKVDSDADGMDDAWEVRNGLDPLRSNGLEDSDNDGSSNFSEYVGNGNPIAPDHEDASAFEGFETGDLTKFYWQFSGDSEWQVTQTKPQKDAFSAQAPALTDGQSGSLATTVNCIEGPVQFFVATSSQVDGDKVSFLVNGELLGEWSGDTPYQAVTFPVEAGKNTFTWTFSKDATVSALQDTAWIDSISFPGRNDMDNDGVIDGWEYAHFNSLDHGLCSDSDNDGLLDIEEILAKTDPLNPDTDGDGDADGVEIASIYQNYVPSLKTSSPASSAAKMLPQPDPPNIIVWERGENIHLPGWDIYDNNPSGADISIRYDDLRLSEVVEFFGDGIDNGYRLRNEDGSWWQDNKHTILQFDIKSNESFLVYAVVQTKDGVRFMQYGPEDEDLLGNELTIEHGLGAHIQDNKWWTIVRDLSRDLIEAQPGNELQSILGFLVRGNCQVDDITTRTSLPPEHDSDGDGLTDILEIETLGTEPYFADSDGDDIEDGQEYSLWGTDWNADPDGDHLINILDPDSDNDGHTDGVEKAAGTDPGNGNSQPQ